MFTTLVAVLCHALVAGADVCIDEVVTDSYLDPRLTWISCQVMAQPGVAVRGCVTSTTLADF